MSPASKTLPRNLRPFTLPNFLTFLRLLALPFLLIAILEGRHLNALLIFLAAAITDIVDGAVARRFGMTSPLGAFLDPIADKFFLVSSYIVFALPSTPSKIHVPTWVLVIVVLRDALLLVVGLVMMLALEVRSFPPSALGKATTFVEISTLVAIMLANCTPFPTEVAEVGFYVVAGFTLGSGFDYVWRVSNSLPSTSGDSAG